jgi:CheY-like chemotaxis protein
LYAKKPVKSVLIVEDETIIARDLENILRGFGYEISGAAATGEQAVELAGSLHPDIILMDIRLPGRLDGVQAAEAIRVRYNIPVVYVTAFGEDSPPPPSGWRNGLPRILKPFSSEEIGRVVHAVIDRAGLGQTS